MLLFPATFRRENRPFDLCHAHLVSGLAGRPLGFSLIRSRETWLDLPIDCPRTLARLERRGFRIARPERHICHWSSYLRPGVFPLYRALIADPVPLPLSILSADEARPDNRAATTPDPGQLSSSVA